MTKKIVNFLKEARERRRRIRVAKFMRDQAFSSYDSWCFYRDFMGGGK